MRNALIAIASGAIITAVSLIMLALAFPIIAPLLAFIILTAFLIVAISILAMIPEFTVAFIQYLRSYLKTRPAEQHLNSRERSKEWYKKKIKEAK